MKSLLPLLLSTLLFASSSRELEILPCPRDNDPIKLRDLDQTKLFHEIKDPPILIEVPPNTQKVLLHESPKPSRLSQDLLRLFEFGKEQFMRLDPKRVVFAPRFEVPSQCVYYQPKFIRSDTTIEAINSDTNQSIHVSFFVGKEDHLYLATDLLISSIKSLYYDPEREQFIEQEEPSSLYFSINYKWGDISTTYPKEQFYKNLSLKLLAKVSKTPNESMGIGLGYHFSENIEFFISEIWTADEAPKIQTSMGYTPTTAFGVSFNLTKALEWIRGKNE